MKDRCHQTRGGFTLIEMLLSMMITAMVVGALGAMFTAAAEGWQTTEARQKISMQGNLTFRQMERLIGSAKLMGLIRTGNSTAVTDPSGALMAILWQHDSNG